MSRGQVFVVDDDVIIAQAICELVETVDLRGRSFGSAEGFLKAYAEDVPTVAVIDVRLPALGGLALQKCLSDAGATAPVIFVTAFGDAWTAVQAMKGGAFDFLEKPFQEQELLTRIQAAITYHAEQLDEQRQRALAGKAEQLAPRAIEFMAFEIEKFIEAATGSQRKGVPAVEFAAHPGALAEDAAEAPSARERAGETWGGLTPRQTEILMALRDGSTNKEIARQMGILEATVKVQLKAIYRTLGVGNRTQAALAANRHFGKIDGPLFSARTGSKAAFSA
ncbi:MAG: response regulator [Rhodospirillales bacterium]|nr:response regulator [Rhodospirillales bacterium]